MLAVMRPEQQATILLPVAAAPVLWVEAQPQRYLRQVLEERELVTPQEQALLDWQLLTLEAAVEQLVELEQWGPEELAGVVMVLNTTALEAL
jgi:hypothetical protein